jgi:hypothetical protein
VPGGGRDVVRGRTRLLDRVDVPRLARSVHPGVQVLGMGRPRHAAQQELTAITESEMT